MQEVVLKNPQNVLMFMAVIYICYSLGVILSLLLMDKNNLPLGLARRESV